MCRDIIYTTEWRETVEHKEDRGNQIDHSALNTKKTIHGETSSHLHQTRTTSIENTTINIYHCAEARIHRRHENKAHIDIHTGRVPPTYPFRRFTSGWWLVFFAFSSSIDVTSSVIFSLASVSSFVSRLARWRFDCRGVNSFFLFILCVL